MTRRLSSRTTQIVYKLPDIVAHPWGARRKMRVMTVTRSGDLRCYARWR